MNIGGSLVSIVDAAQLYRVPRSLRQSHTRATLAEDALVGDFVLLRFATQLLRRDFLEFLLGIHSRRVCSPCHRVSCLATAGDAGEGKVLCRVPPNDVALFPRHSQDFRARAVDINHGLRSQVPDPRLEGDSTIRFDHQKAVESDRAANVAAQRYADAANFRAHPLRRSRDPLAPLELLGTAIKRFLEECAGRILPFSLHRWSERGLAFRAVDAANCHLINSEFARSFRDDGLNDDNPLKAAWGTLRAARRCIRQYRHATPAHSLRLV